LAYRAPENIIVDNGKTYRAKTLTGGRAILKLSPEEISQIQSRLTTCQLFGIKEHFARVRNHHGKDIEREFQRLHRGYCRWFFTYFGVDVTRHPDIYNKIQIMQEKEKLFPTIEQVRVSFDKYLREEHNVYTYQSGENKGKNPITLWNDGYAEYAAKKESHSQQSLMFMCSRMTEPKTIRGNGILDEKTNTYYWHDKFGAMLGEKVYLRIPPNNGSSNIVPQVFCYGENDNFICEATALKRIPKLIDFKTETEREKLVSSLKRVDSTNREIAKHKKDFKPDMTEKLAETAHARIAATRKKLAETRGLDTSEKIIENGFVALNRFDVDIAAAKKQEQEGTKLPAVAVGQDFIPPQEKWRELKRY